MENKNRQMCNTIHTEKDMNSKDVNQRVSDAVEDDSLWNCVNSWAINTACHGVPNIQRTTHPVRKIAWIVIVLAGAGKYIPWGGGGGDLNA